MDRDADIKTLTKAPATNNGQTSVFPDYGS